MTKLTSSTSTLRSVSHASVSATNRSNAGAPLMRPRIGWWNSGSPANEPMSASVSPVISPSKYGTAEQVLAPAPVSDACQGGGREQLRYPGHATRIARTRASAVSADPAAPLPPAARPLSCPGVVLRHLGRTAPKFAPRRPEPISFVAAVHGDSPLSEREHVRVGPGSRKVISNVRSATGRRLSDQLIQARLGDGALAVLVGVGPWAAPGGSPSMRTRKRTGWSSGAGPRTR